VFSQEYFLEISDMREKINSVEPFYRDLLVEANKRSSDEDEYNAVERE
jgi:hypothetical protein